MTVQFLMLFVVSFIYAFMRYVIFGDVSPMHVPAYIINKAISLTAVAALAMAAAGQARGRQEIAQHWWKACWHLIFIHVLLSLVVFSNGYFPKFFKGDTMNATGEATLSFGALAAYCFWRLGVPDLTQSAKRSLAVVAKLLVAGHLVVMGFKGWLQVEKWHGGLPPITLLGFLLLAFSLYTSLRAKGTVPAPAEVV